MQPGDILTKDLQGDMFQGRYQLVEQVSGDVWRVRDLPPTDAEMDQILDFYAGNEQRGCGYMDTPESLQREIDDRYAERIYEVRFVSAERWAAMF